MKLRDKTTNIILHCSATKEGVNYTAKDIRKWHKAQGWEDIGYHYVIDLDGKVEAGRGEHYIGAHCVGRNFDSIGICYIGGLDSNGNPKDTRTPAQVEALYRLVDDLIKKYRLSLKDVHCHNEFSKKDCPCFTIIEFRMGFVCWKNRNGEEM